MESNLHFTGFETLFINKMNTEVGLYFNTEKKMRDLFRYKAIR